MIYINMEFKYDSLTGFPSDTSKLTEHIGSNPIVLVFLIGVIVVYYVLIATLGTKGSEPVQRTQGIAGLEVLLWGVFVVLLITNGMQYFFNVDVSASLQNIMSKKPHLDMSVTSRPGEGNDESDPLTYRPPAPQAPPPPPKEVFYVRDNLYTYSDAKAICEALQGDLATYDQVENAYKSGAEWCGYGWSANQLALFPTQKSTYDKLQAIKGHEHDCGRPGINGGYIANPNVRFGVNCYGVKPTASPEERKDMQMAEIYPKTTEDIAMENRVQYWKDKLHGLVLAPFNKSNWTKI